MAFQGGQMPKSSQQELANNQAEKVADKLKLEHIGRISFLKLCDDGCDPEQLAEYLKLVASKSQIRVRPTNSKRRPYKISTRAFDSLDEALEGLDKRDLPSMQKSALKLAKNIDKLKRTRVVRYMNDDEYNTRFFELPYLLVCFANEFVPLIQKKLELVGVRQRPDFSRYLNELIDYVKESIGKPRYSSLCDVLSALGQNWNESSLKQWRERNKPRDAKTE